jgi:beta-galactosidase
MLFFGKRFPAFLAAALAGISANAQQPASAPNLDFPTILYGAAYYNEYTPRDTPNAQDERLAKDDALTKAAGTNLLDGKPVAKSAILTLKPWDVAIIEEP